MTMPRTYLAVFPFVAVALFGCDYNTQTTSGADYLSGYADSAPVTATYVDQQVREVAAVEPTLRFPALIGLARIDNGEISAIPAAEAEAWAAATRRLGPTFGTFVPVNRLVAEMVAAPVISHKGGIDRLYHAVEKIRLGAARQHLDAVLIYQTHYTADSASNALSIVDWTIIGAFMLPGQSIDATAFASALLVDVRSGYPYGTADTVVDRETISTTFGRHSASNQLGEQARSAAAIQLVDDVEQMMVDLKQELDVADASEDEAWR